MLAADKAALETELKRKALEIQDKELNFFVTNFSSIATQGALLGGFSFSALTLTDFKGIEATNEPFKISYYACTTLAMSFQLVAVLMSTLCNMWGPGLALRGPEGSMKTAVDGMKIEQEWAIRFFALGVFFFHMSSLCYAWVAFTEQRVATVVTVILIVFLMMFFIAAVRINQKFKLKKVVSGAFGVDGGRLEAHRLIAGGPGAIQRKK